MSDDLLKKRVRESFEARRAKPVPAFDATWAAAQAKHQRSQRRYTAAAGLAAAAAILVAVISLMSSNEAPVADDFPSDLLIADALMNATTWSAPSDVLLPEHRFDIYREIPGFIESTDTQDGTLL